ncbi:RNA pyrophosphohydrolase [Sphingomonas changnyeongensis]|uniref:RNA pyrophosphohydrolase n=1 Tax=Sphingomonas changnyeongensis TaxID=2698679 RepID=A0A7Z2NX63_9SPHN|nr:RNA pyrophosphohydrolase [Sphingomonas changnyeongensis]QHL91461.1 RNA pyrophosphohydrolase [Sphingomonas changnyeongensis]
MTDLPYRPCVGVMLVNADNLVFVGQRIDTTLDAWQMPQGGIDPGEDPAAAALRELGEETGVAADLVRIEAQSRAPLDYDLPPDLQARVWGGRYRGQRQTWFLARFLGADADIDIATPHPEFSAWQWVAPARLPELIVPFKRALYEAVLAEFAPLL